MLSKRTSSSSSSFSSLEVQPVRGVVGALFVALLPIFGSFCFYQYFGFTIAQKG